MWARKGCCMTTTALAIPNQQAPLISLEETTTLGSLLAKSGYFQDARDMAQAVVKVLAGRELGFGPIMSMTGIYIVKGRVTLSANLMAAAIKRSGKYTFRVRELSDKACKLEFFEQGQSLGESGFTMEDAKAAKLAGGDNWTHYPRNMLFARALSNGAKWYCPDIFGGPVYTPDELGVEVNGDTGEPARPATLTPVEAAEATPTATATDADAPQPSYEPFGAITMVTKMTGSLEKLPEWFPGCKTKSALEKAKAEEPDNFRAAYDRLHAAYIVWKDQQ